jgi:galactose mutarotase-like enzyme
MSDFVTIASEHLGARISRHGAELWSLTDRQGCEYMTDADPAFWTGHAPLLFPIVGELNGGTYRLGAATYALPRHGFARTRQFSCIMQRATEARLRLTDDEETRTVYPFAFMLEMGFRLDDWTLQMTATVSNHGEEPMPFSFGYHPAFAWPLPGDAAKQAHRITFAQDEPQPLCRLDPATGLVLPELRPTPVAGRELTLSPGLFEADALIWDSLHSCALTYGAPGAASLDIAFPDTTMLGIWQKPGASYLCIEPWQGIADPVGYQGDIRDKPGVILLPAGEEHSYRMNITVKPC